MKRYCHHCGTRLRASELRCSYCRQAAMGWLHVGAIAAFAAAAFLYLLKAL